MNSLEELLENFFAYNEAQKQAATPLPDDVNLAIRTALTRARHRTVMIPHRVMNYVILAIMRKGRVTASEIIPKIQLSGLALESDLEEGCLGIISELESKGLIRSNRNEIGTRSDYEITEEGIDLLAKSGWAIFNRFGITPMVPA